MKYFSKFPAPKTIMRLILFTLVITSSAYAKECFIVSKNNKLIHVEGDCDKRYPPCSTFKIAISLMGFDAGILGWLHRVSQIQLMVISHHISHHLGWFSWGGFE